jgi:hypothetical protein
MPQSRFACSSPRVPRDLERALHDLASSDGFADEALVQDFV